jgi:dTDP-glucose 4,6-dehydratase
MVTGGAGFIGSNFVTYLLQKYPDYRVVVFDKLTYAGNLDNLLEVSDDPRYHFVRGDICEPEPVAATIERYEIDTIVNFAAETHVDRSIMDPDAFIRTDVYGTYVLLEAARRYGLERYHQISTDEVYGHIPEGQSSLETDAVAYRAVPTPRAKPAAT